MHSLSLKSLRSLVFLLIIIFFCAPAWVNTTPNPYAKTDKAYAKAKLVPLPQTIGQQTNSFNQRSNPEAAMIKSEAPEVSGGKYAIGREYGQSNMEQENMMHSSSFSHGGKIYTIKQPSRLSMA